MPAARDVELLVKAARMYFLGGSSQQEIAQVLGTSRSNVSRMLTAAREQGIVEIRINDPYGRVGDLEEQLVARFGLAGARVAREASGQRPLELVAEQASGWLLDSLRDGQTVAVSWGHALQAMAWATTAEHPYAVELVQLVGGLSALASGVTGQELVRELATRLGATYRYLHAPAVLASAEARDALLAERSVQQALDAARGADIALVGIGAVVAGSSRALLDALALTPAEREDFQARGPVGDVAGRFFDAQGQEILGPVHDRVLAVTIDELRAVPLLVGVAAGREKAPGILGALRGGVLDVLVCDASAARAVLALDERTGR